MFQEDLIDPHLLLAALKSNKPDFVRLFLDHGASVTQLAQTPNSQDKSATDKSGAKVRPQNKSGAERIKDVLKELYKVSVRFEIMRCEERNTLSVPRP